MKDTIRKWLTEQFGEDEELFNELYTQYASDMKAMASELPGLIAANDAAMLGERGHAMKGMALQIGDIELSTPCKELQDAGRSGNLPDCEAIVEPITALVNAL